MTVFDEFRKVKNIKRYSGDFGLEIETEGLKKYEIPEMSLWTVHNDPSLRGPAPYEYVLKTPLSFQNEIPLALKEFKEKTGSIKFDEGSFTTSVHVHVNMLNESLVTMGNFFAVYALVENLLKRFAGNTRDSNMFCLPLCDAEQNFDNILNVISYMKQNKLGFVELDQESAKYAALNLCSLNKFGSLEVRLLRGTTDTDLIYDWMGILYSILEFSRQDMTPKDFILLWKNKGTELLTDIFGKYRKLLRYPDEEKIIEQNFWYPANIAMAVQDWRALDKKADTIKKMSSKDLDTLSVKNFGKPFEVLGENEKHAIIQNFKWVDGPLQNPFEGLQPIKHKFVPPKKKAHVAPEDWIQFNPHIVQAAVGNVEVAQAPQPQPVVQWNLEDDDANEPDEFFDEDFEVDDDGNPV